MERCRRIDVTLMGIDDNRPVAIPPRGCRLLTADKMKGLFAVTEPRSHDGQEVFEILVREHAGMLTAYLHSLLNNTSDVDDLFQETMVVAWRRLDDYDRARPFGLWLRGIARNLVLAHYRKGTSAPKWYSPEVLDALDTRFETLASDQGETFRERVDALLGCIQKLSGRLRQVIELAYGRGMSLRDIALTLNEQEVAVRKRAQRARNQLYNCLQNLNG